MEAYDRQEGDKVDIPDPDTGKPVQGIEDFNYYDDLDKNLKEDSDGEKDDFVRYLEEQEALAESRDPEAVKAEKELEDKILRIKEIEEAERAKEEKERQSAEAKRRSREKRDFAADENNYDDYLDDLEDDIEELPIVTDEDTSWDGLY